MDPRQREAARRGGVGIARHASRQVPVQRTGSGDGARPSRRRHLVAPTQTSSTGGSALSLQLKRLAPPTGPAVNRTAPAWARRADPLRPCAARRHGLLNGLGARRVNAAQRLGNAALRNGGAPRRLGSRRRCSQRAVADRAPGPEAAPSLAVSALAARRSSGREAPGCSRPKRDSHGHKHPVAFRRPSVLAHPHPGHRSRCRAKRTIARRCAQVSGAVRRRRPGVSPAARFVTAGHRSAGSPVQRPAGANVRAWGCCGRTRPPIRHGWSRRSTRARSDRVAPEATAAIGAKADPYRRVPGRRRHGLRSGPGSPAPWTGSVTLAKLNQQAGAGRHRRA